jgi:hypothetical protein
MELLKMITDLVIEWALPAYFGIAFFATVYVIWKLTKDIEG